MKKEIDSPGLWLVKFRGTEECEVIRVVEGKMVHNANFELLTCRDQGYPSAGVIPFWVTEGNIEKVYRKIKDPLGTK
jgi:hypothetical protein